MALLLTTAVSENPAIHWQFVKLQNKTRDQVVGHFVKDVLKEGVFEAVVKPKLDECFQGKVVRYETQYTYPELGERDLLVSYLPVESVSGVDRVACILQDITDRKRAEATLAGMSRKLIEAQEQERTQIARDLHDDIAQRLALLAIELEQVQSFADSASELRTHLAVLRRNLTNINRCPNDVARVALFQTGIPRHSCSD